VIDITPELLLQAYANGYFPMADSKDAKELGWYSPEERGIIPLADFHIPKSLTKFLKQHPFTLTTDKAFRDVMQACADREETWINGEIIELYYTLHEMGFAHSVECWEGEKLSGGLYGVALAGAFFGESMFSRTSGASKVALVHLVELLKKSGYTLLDTQYVNDYLKQFGGVEIAKEEYLLLLEKALKVEPNHRF
jgi:leucyl/phenylalanyl-tRNA--protein transferase